VYRSRYTAAVIRVAIAQEIVPHYRVPFFRKLAAVPGVQLHLLADKRHAGGSLAPAGEAELDIRQADHRQLGPFFWQPRTLAEAARGAVDVLVMNWNLRRLEQVPALLAARARGVGTLLWGHGYAKHDTPAKRAARDRTGALADATLFYTAPVAEAYVARGHRPDRVFVAPNAIDQAPVEAARRAWLDRPADLRAFAAQHGLRPDRTALFVARLEPAKRIDRLLAAFAIVAKTLPDARLVIVGGGPEEPYLRARAAELGIGDAVIFAGPIHDQMALAPWFLNAAVAAFPIDVGLSVLHAFGFGLPLVTSDDLQRHGPEIVALRPGENGLLYRAGDVEHLAEQMGAVMADPALRARLAEGALATVREPGGYTLDRMLEGFLEAIDAVAGLRGKRR